MKARCGAQKKKAGVTYNISWNRWKRKREEDETERTEKRKGGKKRETLTALLDRKQKTEVVLEKKQSINGWYKKEDIVEWRMEDVKQ